MRGFALRSGTGSRVQAYKYRGANRCRAVIVVLVRIVLIAACKNGDRAMFCSSVPAQREWHTLHPILYTYRYIHATPNVLRREFSPSDSPGHTCKQI